VANLQIEQDGKSGGVCECCGNESSTVWGYVYSDGEPFASYFVHWTRNKPDHFPNFDIIFGTWGDPSINDRKLASWIFNPSQEDGGFMVVDSGDREISNSDLVSESLTREQVVGDANYMEIITSIIDAIWLQDERIDEIRAWTETAL
jgi:hypothetical protein